GQRQREALRLRPRPCPPPIAPPRGACATPDSCWPAALSSSARRPIVRRPSRRRALLQRAILRLLFPSAPGPRHQRDAVWRRPPRLPCPPAARRQLPCSPALLRRPLPRRALQTWRARARARARPAEWAQVVERERAAAPARVSKELRGLQ